MKKFTFRGGIHPPGHKKMTQGIPIRTVSAPEIVAIPLLQHIGAVCEPLVKAGDIVDKGQKIGDSNGYISAPVHGSVSGKVIGIESRIHPSGSKIPSVIIENDGEDRISEDIGPKGEYLELKPEEIVKIVREAGIVGMGGAAFPTHVKLIPPEGKQLECLIINGSECEPYLTGNHRVMLEQTEDIIYGLRVMLYVLNLKKGIIAVEDNKMDAIEKLLECTANDPEIEIRVVKTKYPQGSEKHLIKMITGREVRPGALPADVGVVVNNIDTCAAISNVLKTGMPLINRVVTVAGKGVVKPGNFLVPIGTSFRETFEYAGGLKGDICKVIMGGPMMGMTQYDLDAPVIKGTSGLLALTANEVYAGKEYACVRCGRCVRFCPVGLMPLYLSQYSKHEDVEMLDEYHAMDCIECGSCAYVCPSRTNPVQYIRVGKAKLLSNLKNKTKGGEN